MVRRNVPQGRSPLVLTAAKRAAGSGTLLCCWGALSCLMELGAIFWHSKSCKWAGKQHVAVHACL